MAMGFDFALDAGETATRDFLLSTTVPASGFFLSHTDPDSQSSAATIYFSSQLAITGSPAPAPVPEPSMWLLLGTGLISLLGYHRMQPPAVGSK